MGTPVPFQPKPDRKGNIQPWVAIIPGKGLTEIAEATATLEIAQQKLTELLKSSTVSTQNTPKTNDSKSDSINASPNIAIKPKPGETNPTGLGRLSPERLKVLREKIAVALASGNVSIDRALVSIFRDDVPVISPDSYLLLSAGWELACEQYFISGIVPPWLLILLGNVQVMGAMIEASKAKKREEPANADAATAAIVPRRNAKDK